jgi:sorbose reductase
MNFQDYGFVRQGFPRPFPGTPSNVMEQLRLYNKVAVITGGADATGFAVTEAMADAFIVIRGPLPT